MNLSKLRGQIDKLLAESGISSHTKDLLLMLLPIMEEGQLRKVLNDLVKENRDLKKLSKKEKRLKLRYEVTVDKLKNFNEKIQK